MPDGTRHRRPERPGARPPPARPVTVASVPLPGGRTLEVRPMLPDDAPAMEDLFGSLPPGDLYLRFFSGHPPPGSFVAHMAGVARRGGTGLVASVRTRDGRPPGPGARLVAEASAEPLPDGGAELGITVLPGRRGWLGPYLLDLLATRAARRGLADLQAEVLVENHRMLALLRARGCAVLRRDDRPAVLRVVVATAGGMPAWPGRHDRVRVLAEVPAGHWRAEELARGAGFAVITCPGSRPGFRTCPAGHPGGGAPCPLVADADVVVVAGGDATGLVAHHRRWHPSAVLRLDPPPPAPAAGPPARVPRPRPAAAGSALPAPPRGDGGAVVPALPRELGAVVPALQAAAVFSRPSPEPGPPTIQPGGPSPEPGPPSIQPGPPTIQPGPPTIQEVEP